MEPKTSSKGARSPRKKGQPKTPFELDQEAKQARLQKLRDAAKNARPATQQQAREFIARIQAVTAKVDDKSDWRPSEAAQRGLSKLKGAGLMLRMGGGGGLMGLLGAMGGGRGDGAGYCYCATDDIGFATLADNSDYNIWHAPSGTGEVADSRCA